MCFKKRSHFRGRNFRSPEAEIFVLQIGVEQVISQIMLDVFENRTITGTGRLPGTFELIQLWIRLLRQQRR